MSSKRETVLLALYGAIRDGLAVAAPKADVRRGDALPAEIPRGGLVILRDGDPGEPEVTLSPLTYHYTHRAEVEIVTQDAPNGDKRFDDLASAIGAALALDRTLGGTCDWAQPDAPQPVEIPIDGGAPIKAAIVPVMLYYAASDPLA